MLYQLSYTPKQTTLLLYKIFYDLSSIFLKKIYFPKYFCDMYPLFLVLIYVGLINERSFKAMEDTDIIKLYFERDEKALKETGRKYGRGIRSVAYAVLKNSSDAEECENDTYHSAWNAIPPSKPQRLGAFLYRIARNAAVDRYKHDRAQKRGSEYDAALSELEGMLSAGETPDSIVEADELAAAIVSFLKTLSQTKRIVFIHRYWYCRSIAEIAELSGFSQSKIRTMLMRVRNELKKHLERQGYVL